MNLDMFPLTKEQQKHLRDDGEMIYFVHDASETNFAIKRIDNGIVYGTGEGFPKFDNMEVSRFILIYSPIQPNTKYTIRINTIKPYGKIEPPFPLTIDMIDNTKEFIFEFDVDIKRIQDLTEDDFLSLGMKIEDIHYADDSSYFCYFGKPDFKECSNIYYETDYRYAEYAQLIKS